MLRNWSTYRLVQHFNLSLTKYLVKKKLVCLFWKIISTFWNYRVPQCYVHPPFPWDLCLLSSAAWRDRICLWRSSSSLFFISSSTCVCSIFWSFCSNIWSFSFNIWSFCSNTSLWCWIICKRTKSVTQDADDDDDVPLFHNLNSANA